MSGEQKENWSDGEFVLEKVTKNGLVLRSASEDLKNNKEIVLAAVRENGIALKDASERLKDDKEVVLAAVGQNGRALKNASDRLTGDIYVVLAAMMQYPDAFVYSDVSNSEAKPILDSIRELCELVKDVKIYYIVSKSEVEPTLDSTEEHKEGDLKKKADRQKADLRVFSNTTTNDVVKEYLKIMKNLKNNPKISSKSKTNEEIIDNKIILTLIGIEEDTIYLWSENIQKYKKFEEEEKGKGNKLYFKLRF